MASRAARPPAVHRRARVGRRRVARRRSASRPSAAEALGDIVYLELPAVGDDRRRRGRSSGRSSRRSPSPSCSRPVSGTVAEVNQAAVDDPSLVNADPFGAGWLLKVDVTSAGRC